MSKATFDPSQYNRSENEPFEQVLDKHLSRRHFVRGGLGISALTAVSSLGLAGCSSDASSPDALPAGNPDPGPELPNRSDVVLGFDSIEGAKLDAVVVPAGYSAQVLAPWGTPLNSQAQDWQADGSNTAIDQQNSVGMHHDGLHFFPLNESDEDGLLCINHEYIDQAALHPNGATLDASNLRIDIDEVRKEISAPRCIAVTAVIQRAAGLTAIGRETCY